MFSHHQKVDVNRHLTDLKLFSLVRTLNSVMLYRKEVSNTSCCLLKL